MIQPSFAGRRPRAAIGERCSLVLQYDSGMALAGVVINAFLQYDPFKGEFWTHLPQIMTAAKNNPLGVIFGIVCLVSLVGLGITWKQSEKTRLAIFLGVFVVSILGIAYAGNAQLGKNPGPSSMSVSGRVIDHKTGGPVARAKVSLVSQGLPATRLANSDGFWQANISRPEAGAPIKVYVEADGYENHNIDVTVEAAAQPLEIPLDPREHSNIPPPPGPVDGPRVTLLGKVFTQDHSPIENAEVVLESGGSPPHAEPPVYTDSTGEFRLVKVPLRPDLNLKITVRAKGFKTKAQNLPPSIVKQMIEIRMEKDSSN
jgi:hypothetical protein